MEDKSLEMTIESLKLKIENQAKLIKELTNENEELYHQYNHLIIRNGKMLKRIDDYQKIIDDLHIRNEEFQLINSNMMQINDKLRNQNEASLRHRMNQRDIAEASSSADVNLDMQLDMDDLYIRWKNYPGQVAHNGPNLRKQVLMLAFLYKTKSLKAAELFGYCGVGGVTGARYVSSLKKFELIKFSGARKKGQYEITSKGIEFMENIATGNNTVTTERVHSVFVESAEDN